MPRPVAALFIGVALLGVLVLLSVFAVDFGRMPEIVPTHFGASGAPNSWGPKATFVVFPAIGVVVCAIVVFVSLFGIRSNRILVPPVLPILTTLVFVEVIWVLVIAQSQSIAVALGRAAAMNATLMILGIAVEMITAALLVIVAVIAAVRARSL